MHLNCCIIAYLVPSPPPPEQSTDSDHNENTDSSDSVANIEYLSSENESFFF